jgi:hypothetical protein
MNRPTPLHTDATWIKKFNAAVGPTNPKEQQQLATKMHIKYKGGARKVIWAITTCRPDIAFTSMKLSQSNLAPTVHRFHGLKHAICYVYIMHNEGIYFWCTSPCHKLPEGPLPTRNINLHDLLLNDCPEHDAWTAVA